MQTRNGITRRHILKAAGAAGGLALAGRGGSGWAQPARRIEQLDPGLDSILSASQPIQELDSGYARTSSPSA